MVSIPTIHLNGTSGMQLLDDHLAAVEALRDAWKALAAAAPNGRDYYPQGPGAFSTAIDQHADRLSRLDKIKKEIEEIAVAISNVGAFGPAAGGPKQ
jgi:hypothetical protein